MINSSFWMTRVKDISAYGGDCISELSVMKACQSIPLVNQVYFNDYPLRLSKEKSYYNSLTEIADAWRRVQNEVDVIHTRGIEPFEVIRARTRKPMVLLGGVTEKEPTKDGIKIDSKRMMKADALEVFAPCWRKWFSLERKYRKAA